MSDNEYYEEGDGYEDDGGGYDDYSGGYQEEYEENGEEHENPDPNSGYQDEPSYQQYNRYGAYGNNEHVYDNNINDDVENEIGYDSSEHDPEETEENENYDDTNVGIDEADDYDYHQDEPDENEYHSEDNEEDYGEEVVSASVMHASDDSPQIGSLIKGAMDGFGNGGFNGIVGQIGSIINQSGGITGGSGLTNILASGGMDSMVGNLIASASHKFFGINPVTGQILGAIAGNLIFNMGGHNNSLSNIGKMVLENIITGKFKRDVHPFVPGDRSAFNESFQTIDFQQERQRCLQERVLFEDPQFPADDRSLYYHKRPDVHVQWRRPGEIFENPQLIVGEKSRFDVKQGALGDCWLLAAVANLTLRDELFYRVVPPDQSFTDNYAGIFHFQFWRYGKWVDVVIDDRLPTVDGKLYYMRSNEHKEFWSALLEKAYAKLYGGYENLDGGTTCEALEDFTGGLTEYFDLEKADKSTILAMLVRGMQMGSLFGCSIDADDNVREAQLHNGLVRGHAYSITAIQTININSQQIPLLRIRNPWGNSKEWNGAWSDNSHEWDYVDYDQKEKLGVNFAKDGEFWMSFDDFCANFTQLEVCNLSAEIMDEITEMTGVEILDKQQKHQWAEMSADGEWSSKHGTAGGCQNNDSYCYNPQFGTFFHAPESSVENDGKCTVIVAVMQKYRRELRSQNLDNLPIGFSVYKADGVSYPLTDSSIRSQKPVARTKVFINTREVTVRFRIQPGNYVIIPCTFDSHDDASFLLRIYSNTNMETKQLR